jgi:hypothetical protein
MLARNILLAAGCYLAALGYLGGLYAGGITVRGVFRGSSGTRTWMALGWGVAVAALAGLGFGLVGLLFRPILWFMLLAPCVAGGSVVRAGAWRRIGVADLRPGLWLLPAVPWLLAGPLLPPTNVDTLGGHLGLPALWLLAHKVTMFAGNPYYCYPLGFERALLPLYAVVGPGAVNASTVLLLGGAAAALACALRPAVPALAPWGGWLLFGCAPALANAGDGHPDTGLVLAAALGVLALAAPAVPSRPATGLVRGGAMDLGLAAGLACLDKYTGIPLAVALLIAGWARFRRLPFIAAAACLILNAPWLVRNVLSVGNPVYPFGAAWLPSLRWTPWNGAILWGTMRDASVAWGWTYPEDGVRAFLALPWQAARNTWFAPHVLLLYLLPVLLLVRPARAVAGWALVFAILWAVPEPKFGRYLLPVVAPLLGALMLSASTAPAGRWTRGALGVVLLMGGLAFIPQARPAGLATERVLAGTLAPEAYRRARLGVWCETVDWINAHAPGGRVVVVGHVYGLGLAAPWLANDDASPPAFRLALGDHPEPRRLRIGARQAGVRWILYNPIRSAYRKDWVRGNVTDAWLAGYAAFWRSWTDLIRAPDRFDDTGGWYLYAVRSTPAPAGGGRPLPWLPGAECLQQDELEVLHGRPDMARLAAQDRVMGDFGIAWSQHALVSYRLRHDTDRAIREEREAVRRGLETPWACGLEGLMLWSAGRLGEAAGWERRVLALKPDMPEARAILDDIERRTARHPR